MKFSIQFGHNDDNNDDDDAPYFQKYVIPDQVDTQTIYRLE